MTEVRFKFALESLKKCIMIEPKKSIFFSPHLIYQNLLCVYFAASGNIENSLKCILCIPDNMSKEDVKQQYKSEVKKFYYYMNRRNYSCECEIFSTIYVNQIHLIPKETQDLFTSNYQKIKKFNFKKDIINVINTEINNITKSKVKDLLPPNSIDSKADLIMANAIYLKGQLKFGYDIEDSHRENTETDENSESEIFNNGKSEQLNAYITELYFDVNSISVFFLEPCNFELDEDSSTKNDKVIQLIERLTTEEGSRVLRELLDKRIEQKFCKFPMFEIKQDLQIYELLKMLDVEDLTPFSNSEIDLSDLTTKNLKLGDAVHRVSIKMKGENIIAVANNAFFTNNSYEHKRTDCLDYVLFPCVCLIYDKLHKNILFCGVLFSYEN